MAEKILIFGKIFEIDILMDLHVLTILESENHIFRGWSVCMCVSLCVSVVSITQIQINAETSNLVFYICIINR